MNESQPISPSSERVQAKLAGGRGPYVTLKAAASLDGKIATRGGESQWITGEAARFHAHRLRAGHAAILVGIGTTLADNPRLTARLPGGEVRPARIVLDSKARLEPEALLLNDDGARRVVVCGSRAPQERIDRLTRAGAEVCRCPTQQPRAADFLPWLRQAGLSTVLVEGGARIHGRLIAEGEADELFLYLAGRLIGGRDAPCWFDAPGVEALADTPRLRMSPPQILGEDVLLHGIFQAPS